MSEFYVICDNIRSLENIGSIFRTADALAVSKVFLCGISGKMPLWETGLHKRISKTALGAEKTVAFEYCKQTGKIDKLKDPAFARKLTGYVGRGKISIVALEQNLPAWRAGKKAIVFTKFKPKFPLALIVGNEVKGISKTILKKSDKIIYLPMLGQKESLNVSVAFGVAGYYIMGNKYN